VAADARGVTADDALRSLPRCPSNLARKLELNAAGDTPVLVERIAADRNSPFLSPRVSNWTPP